MPDFVPVHFLLNHIMDSTIVWTKHIRNGLPFFFKEEWYMTSARVKKELLMRNGL